jgi:hypothetical protein
MRRARRGLMTSGIVLLHDNACLHTAAHILSLLEHFDWQLFDHPPLQPWYCSKRLAPVYLPEDLVVIIAFQQQWAADGRCQNVVELTGSRLLWHIHKNLFSNITSDLLPAVTTFRSSLIVYIYFVYNIFFP